MLLSVISIASEPIATTIEFETITIFAPSYFFLLIRRFASCDQLTLAYPDLEQMKSTHIEKNLMKHFFNVSNILILNDVQNKPVLKQ